MNPVSERRIYPVAFAGLAASILGVAVFVVHTPDFVLRPNWLSLGVTADLTLGIPLLYYWLVVRKYRVEPFTVLVVFLFAVAVASQIIPAGSHYYLGFVQKLVVLTELSLIGFGAIRIGRVIRCFQRLSLNRNDFIINLHQSLARTFGPSGLIQVVGTEISVLRYGLFCWLGKSERLPGQTSFTTHRQAGYPAVSIALMAVLLVETGAVHLLLTRWSPVLAALTTGLSLYSGLILVADLSAVLKRPLLIHDGQLHLRAGIRWRATIPLAQIDRAEEVRELPKADPSVLNCALTGSPNVLIHLKIPVPVSGWYGLPKTTTKIAFNVDDERVFLATLTAGA